MLDLITTYQSTYALSNQQPGGKAEPTRIGSAGTGMAKTYDAPERTKVLDIITRVIDIFTRLMMMFGS